MTQQSELQLAQQLLESFVQHSTEHEDHEALVALEKGLALLSDIQEAAIDVKERTVATNLFNTYARITEERVVSLLADVDSIPNKIVGHWYSVMEEFARCDIPLSESFREKQSQLVECIVKNIRFAVLELPPSLQRAFLSKYPFLQ